MQRPLSVTHVARPSVWLLDLKFANIFKTLWNLRVSEVCLSTFYVKHC